MSTGIDQVSKDFCAGWDYERDKCEPKVEMRSETVMTHAIIRGKNGRRYEVDFEDAPIRVEVYSSEETIEIFIEADFETLPVERRRSVLLNLPRHLFSEATGAAARRAAKRNR
jgi:hypothetical protein